MLSAKCSGCGKRSVIRVTEVSECRLCGYLRCFGADICGECITLGHYSSGTPNPHTAGPHIRTLTMLPFTAAQWPPTTL